jgi:4-hydroxy-tetrahydrodipicolinate synthase/2-dehydro-3-deoxy-phosphogluconate/2-dehydro-3-deoxy-6-phosphogalactonate aldolase
MLRGIVPPVLTIFQPDGSLDVEGTRAQIRFVVERGVHAVFVLGTNGEAPLLTLEEKQRVIDTAAEEVNKKVPLAVGVGCPGTAETIALARHAQRAGADVLVVITPYFFIAPAEGLVRHHQALAAAVDVDLPVLLYHNPAVTHYPLTLETLRRLAKVPGVVGLKDSSCDLAWIGRVRRAFPKWALLNGGDALVHACLLLGCDGSVSGVANAFPEVLVALYEAAQQGDHERAKKLQLLAAKLEALAYSGPPLAGIKAALTWRGLSAGEPRLPLIGLSQAEREDLYGQLERLKPELPLS